jgi:NAD-dependent DNA ligase
VVKVSSFHYQDELGFTAKCPRWAMAYKFKSEQVSTKLNSISYQIGEQVRSPGGKFRTNWQGTIVKGLLA